MISDWGIMELSENWPALWSVIMQRFVLCGFGMACVGMLYMPGRRLVPKGGEKCSLLSSMSICERRKEASDCSFGIGREASCVVGYPGLRVSAHGQKPSQSPLQTDWTNC